MTQQAFEVAYKKDSGISMQRCQEREATGGRTPRKMARLKDPAPASFSVPLIFEKGRGERPGRQSTTQAQGLKNFQLRRGYPAYRARHAGTQVGFGSLFGDGAPETETMSFADWVIIMQLQHASILLTGARERSPQQGPSSGQGSRRQS